MNEEDSPWVSEQLQGAIAMHEMYLNYRRGGFSRTQALHIVTAILLDGVRYSKEHGDDNI